MENGYMKNQHQIDAAAKVDERTANSEFDNYIDLAFSLSKVITIGGRSYRVLTDPDYVAMLYTFGPLPSGLFAGVLAFRGVRGTEIILTTEKTLNDVPDEMLSFMFEHEQGHIALLDPHRDPNVTPEIQILMEVAADMYAARELGISEKQREESVDWIYTNMLMSGQPDDIKQQLDHERTIRNATAAHPGNAALLDNRLAQAEVEVKSINHYIAKN